MSNIEHGTNPCAEFHCHKCCVGVCLNTGSVSMGPNWKVEEVMLKPFPLDDYSLIIGERPVCKLSSPVEFVEVAMGLKRVNEPEENFVAYVAEAPMDNGERGWLIKFTRNCPQLTTLPGNGPDLWCNLKLKGPQPKVCADFPKDGVIGGADCYSMHRKRKK